MIAGRDKTNLAAAMVWQAAAARTALATSPEFAETPITAVLCFIDADLPLVGNPQIGDMRVR